MMYIFRLVGGFFQNKTFLIQRSRVVREEGEEKHPPVGKDINRPKKP